MDIFDRIDRRLRENGSTKRALCEATGIPYSSLMTLYQRRSGNMANETAIKIADFLGVSLDYLLRGVGTPRPLEDHAAIRAALETQMKSLGVIREDGTVDEERFARFLAWLKSSAELIVASRGEV